MNYIIGRHWIMTDKITIKANNHKEAFERARNTPRTEGYYMPNSISLDTWITESDKNDSPRP